MHYRLAAIDIDDTLLGPDGLISGANARAVAALRAAGVHVVLASGRGHFNMLPYHEALGLRGPMVSAQGAVVREVETGETWHAMTMAWDDVAELTRDGRRRGFVVQHYTPDAVRIDGTNAWSDRDQAANARAHVRLADLLAEPHGDVAKVIWLGDPAAIARETAGARAAWAARACVTPTAPPFLEFTHVDANKATGVAVVAERLGVPRPQVVAFGDGENDAPVLAWAGLGVAMAHCSPAARHAADLVAPEGDPETALARAIGLVLDGAAVA